MLNQDGEPPPAITMHLALLLQTFHLEHFQQIAILGFDRLLDDIKPTLMRIVLNILDHLLSPIPLPHLIRIPLSPPPHIHLAPQIRDRGVETSGTEGPQDNQDEESGRSGIGEELEKEETDAGEDGGSGERARTSGGREGAEGAEGGVGEGEGSGTGAGGCRVEDGGVGCAGVMVELARGGQFESGSAESGGG